MKRFVVALALIAGAFLSPLSGQTLDSTRTDSVAVWSTKTTEWFTKVDTVTVVDTLFVPVPAPGVALGKPYGPARVFDAATHAPFTHSGAEASNSPEALLANIAEARRRGITFIANLPCGGHSSVTGGRCMSQNAKGVWVFDPAKFLEALAQYNTPEVRAAVNLAVADGVLLGINLMDEPWVSGGDDGAGTVVPNSWGPAGTVTKTIVDGLCTEARKVFPAAPLGTSDHLTAWEPTVDRKVCDFGLFQFSHRFGDVATWRDAVLALAKRGGTQVVFSFNIVNGGTQDRTGSYDCPGSVPGSRSPNCQMTPAQVVAAVDALGDAGCGGLMMWRYEADRFALPGYPEAFAEAAGIQAQRSKRPCALR